MEHVVIIGKCLRLFIHEKRVLMSEAIVRHSDLVVVSNSIALVVGTYTVREFTELREFRTDLTWSCLFINTERIVWVAHA